MTETKTKLNIMGFRNECSFKAMKYITPDFDCRGDNIRAQVRYRTNDELNKMIKFIIGFNMNAKSYKEQLYYNCED